MTNKGFSWFIMDCLSYQRHTDSLTNEFAVYMSKCNWPNLKITINPSCAFSHPVRVCVTMTASTPTYFFLCLWYISTATAYVTINSFRNIKKTPWKNICFYVYVCAGGKFERVYQSRKSHSCVTGFCESTEQFLPTLCSLLWVKTFLNMYVISCMWWCLCRRVCFQSRVSEWHFGRWKYVR